MCRPAVTRRWPSLSGGVSPIPPGCTSTACLSSTWSIAPVGTSPDRLLLRRGCVIDTEPSIVVRPETDVLVENGRIAAVGPELPTAGAMVLDVANRIVLPGFVDTHRHTWQAVLRGVAVDADLGKYVSLVLGRFAPRFRPDD